jgi:hypothetical protein
MDKNAYKTHAQVGYIETKWKNTPKENKFRQPISTERFGVWDIRFPLAYYSRRFLMDLRHLLC